MKTTKARQSARGQDCTLRVSGYMGCSDTDTTVLAHAPCRDDGKGFKSPDLWAAFGCFNCHTLIDDLTSHLTPLERAQGWLRGIYETQRAQGVFDMSFRIQLEK